jgi:hypothetical protein
MRIPGERRRALGIRGLDTARHATGRCDLIATHRPRRVLEMAEGLILEFDGVGRDQYNAVNGQLGIDPDTGQGDWPAGLVFHAGGAKPGGWVVFEMWDSRQAQEQFMNERLGRALQEGGINRPPARVEWLESAAYHSPGS